MDMSGGAATAAQRWAAVDAQRRLSSVREYSGFDRMVASFYITPGAHLDYEPEHKSVLQALWVLLNQIRVRLDMSWMCTPLQCWALDAMAEQLYAFERTTPRWPSAPSARLTIAHHCSQMWHAIVACVDALDSRDATYTTCAEAVATAHLAALSCTVSLKAWRNRTIMRVTDYTDIRPMHSRSVFRL